MLLSDALRLSRKIIALIVLTGGLCLMLGGGAKPVKADDCELQYLDCYQPPPYYFYINYETCTCDCVIATGTCPWPYHIDQQTCQCTCADLGQCG